MYCEIKQLSRLLIGYASILRKAGGTTEAKRQHSVMKLNIVNLFYKQFYTLSTIFYNGILKTALTLGLRCLVSS